MTISVLDQLNRWVEGESIHVNELGCVPDFSCCGGELADEDTRRRYKQAFLEVDICTLELMSNLFLEKHLLDIAKRG